MRFFMILFQRLDIDTLFENCTHFFMSSLIVEDSNKFDWSRVGDLGGRCSREVMWSEDRCANVLDSSNHLQSGKESEVYAIKSFDGCSVGNTSLFHVCTGNTGD